jgi:hypothetical protein
LGDNRTSLVDTRIALADAPAAARDLFRRLVDVGAIESRLRDDVPLSLGMVFPVREGFVGFDAGIEEQFRPRIHGVAIEVAGHIWRNGQADGNVSLIEEKQVGDGLFYNIEGSSVLTCPTCKHSTVLGEDGSEFIHDSLTAWCESPYRATMKCPACQGAASLRNWRSSNHSFAAGNLAFTLWGGYVTALFEKPSPPAGQYLRRLVGDLSDSFIPVFCHI